MRHWFEHNGERVSVSGSNGFVAFARVVRSVCRDAANVLVGRNLVQEIGQHWRITDVAAGHFYSPDFQCFLIDPYAYLAPYPTFGTTMLAGIPRALTFGFDPCAVHCPAGHHEVMSREGIKRFRGPVPPRYGRLTFSVRCPSRQIALQSPAGQWAAKGAEVRYRPIQPDELQQALHTASSLPQWQPE